MSDASGHSEFELTPQEEAILQERARVLSQMEEDQTRENPIPIVAFALGDRGYAIDVKWLVEVVPRPPITPIPGMPPFILGAVNLRGNIITLTDLELFLGIGEIGDLESKAEMIVVETDKLTTAILVDEVRIYRELAASEIEPPMMNLEDNQFRELLGEVRLEGELYALLDMEPILESPKIIVQ